ncbi:MAG: hypothetical protein J0H82_15105 [Alphaproteobacteria bacterium]|jgi:hypothetical protein|nr:hypothetical protein [Alphaproteobacteria bacterium]
MSATAIEQTRPVIGLIESSNKRFLCSLAFDSQRGPLRMQDVIEAPNADQATRIYRQRLVRTLGLHPWTNLSISAEDLDDVGLPRWHVTTSWMTREGVEDFSTTVAAESREDAIDLARAELAARPGMCLIARRAVWRATGISR